MGLEYANDIKLVSLLQYFSELLICLCSFLNTANKKAGRMCGVCVCVYKYAYTHTHTYIYDFVYYILFLKDTREDNSVYLQTGRVEMGY